MHTYILIYPLNIRAKKQNDKTHFVITYNPTLHNLTSIIHKQSNILYSSDHCKNVLKTLPFVAYRRCKNISDILIRTQLTKTHFNSVPVLNSCTTCPCIEHDCNKYTFYPTRESHKIESHITCNTFNVIYMIHRINYVVLTGNQTLA